VGRGVGDDRGALRRGARAARGPLRARARGARAWRRQEHAGVADGLEAALPLLADYVERERAEADCSWGRTTRGGVVPRARDGRFVHPAAEAFQKAKAPARARGLAIACSGARSARARRRRRRDRSAFGSPRGPRGGRRRALARVRAPDLPWGRRRTPRSRSWRRRSRSRATSSSRGPRRSRARGGPTTRCTRSIASRRRRSPRERARTEPREGGRAVSRRQVWRRGARARAVRARGGSHVAEDAFRAARALARADRDERAILALGQVTKDHAGRRGRSRRAFSSDGWSSFTGGGKRRRRRSMRTSRSIRTGAITTTPSAIGRSRVFSRGRARRAGTVRAARGGRARHARGGPRADDGCARSVPRRRPDSRHRAVDRRCPLASALVARARRARAARDDRCAAPRARGRRRC